MRESNSLQQDRETSVRRSDSARNPSEEVSLGRRRLHSRAYSIILYCTQPGPWIPKPQKLYGLRV